MHFSLLFWLARFIRHGFSPSWLFLANQVGCTRFLSLVTSLASHVTWTWQFDIQMMKDKILIWPFILAGVIDWTRFLIRAFRLVQLVEQDSTPSLTASASHVAGMKFHTLSLWLLQLATLLRWNSTSVHAYSICRVCPFQLTLLWLIGSIFSKLTCAQVWIQISHTSVWNFSTDQPNVGQAGMYACMHRCFCQLGMLSAHVKVASEVKRELVVWCMPGPFKRYTICLLSMVGWQEGAEWVWLGGIGYSIVVNMFS